MKQQTENVRKSYDAVADEYVVRIYHELEFKPLEREHLNRFVQSVGRSGLICDMGCGPGHVARYLSEQGALVTGIDLSPRMVELAQSLNPGIEFHQGNMAALDLDNESFAGIVAFYSLIHFPREQLVTVLQELNRVLQVNGPLLLAFHKGQEIRHMEEWWGKQVQLDGTFFEREEMESYLQQACFVVEESIERTPYPEVEAQTQRLAIFARKRT